MFNIFKNDKKEEKNESLFLPKIDDFRSEENIKENLSVTEQQEEWIWVDGYKGTDKDMCCQPGGLETKTQYELNKEFVCDDDIIKCGYGFHFCEKLPDVFGYYNLDLKNRFFKVKGLVNKKRSTYKTLTGYISCDTKLVAKSIYLLKELTYDDLKEYINDEFSLINNEEDYNNSCIIGYQQFVKNNFMSQMKKYEFSDLYSLIQFDVLYNRGGDYIIDKFLRQVQAYYQEEISKDLMIYLLEQYKRELIKR